MEINGVIFDMDGLIFDSERWSNICYRQACEQLGYPYSAELFKKMMGAVMDDSLRLQMEFYQDRKVVDEIMTTYEGLFEKALEEGKVGLMKGAWELIHFLKDHDFPMCLATSTRMTGVQAEFSHSPFQKIPFEHMVTGEAGAKGKPDPDVFLKAAALIGQPIETCVVLEDSINGMHAAIAAHSISIMVPDQLAPTPDIRAQASYIMPDLTAVQRFLEPYVLGPKK